MILFGYILYILLYYSLFVYTYRSSEENYRMYTTNEKFKLQSLTLCKRIKGETYMASSSAKPNHSIPISSIPPRMDTYMRTAYDITGDNEKYELLMNVVPSSILFDIHVNFQLDSIYMVISKRIPEEDLWYKAAFTYQREAWFD